MTEKADKSRQEPKKGAAENQKKKSGVRLFLTYLYSCRRAAAFEAAAAAVFFAVLFLWRLPTEALLYALLLSLLPAGLAIAAGFSRFLRLHGAAELAKASDMTPEALPCEGAEKELHALVLQREAELRQCREKLRERETELKRYCTLWAHQIKTPLAAMRLQAQELDSPELIRQLVKTEQYVDMVLQFARKDGSDYVFCRVNPAQTARQALRRCSVLFIAKRLRVEFRVPDFYVISDAKWLGFVVEQLLTNAAKYTPEGGTVTVSGDERECSLSVADTGVGIPAQELPRVCELGYTGLAGRDNARSTGIGLYLCREICSRLSTPMSIESEVGKGTRVTLCLHKEEY